MAALSYFVVILLSYSYCVAVEQSTSNGNLPNILLLMADQMRGDMLGSSGNKITRTPNLDMIASQGV